MTFDLDALGDWQPCATGELAQMVKRLHRRRLFRQIASRGWPALVLAIPICYLGWRSWPRGERHYGGIGCREMLLLLHDFEEDSLTSKKKAQVRAHLAECDNCWLMQQYRKAQDEHTSV